MGSVVETMGFTTLQFPFGVVCLGSGKRLPSGVGLVSEMRSCPGQGEDLT